MRVEKEGTVGKLASKSVCVVIIFCAAALITSSAQTFTTLVNFNTANGRSPAAPLIQATDGNFYGTTSSGGANALGTVFRMTPGGALTTLHSFSGADGSAPLAVLVQGTDGNFYGTTSDGGANNSANCFNGCGTVFKITPAGAMTTLYSFCAQPSCADGLQPEAGLIQATDGNLYGTTFKGGGASCFLGSCGTVFRITFGGILTTLHSFNGTDGSLPWAELVQATDGNFYGTTTYGGTPAACPNGPLGCGTVFKMSPAGTLTTLYSFCTQTQCGDGSQPYAGLVQATDGSLYGATIGGGAYGYGTIFKITLSGALNTLHSFNIYTDDASPYARLVQATDGNFYGTTAPQLGNGTIFKITPRGTLTTLYTFCSQTGCSDGYSPSGLIQATDANFYGTTQAGGSANDGTAFSLDAGLSVTLNVITAGNGIVFSGDGHINCGSACSHRYPIGRTLALTALPAVGNTLSSWSGCTSTQGNVCKVVVSGPVSVSATFTPSPVTFSSLTFNPSTARHGNIAVGTLTLASPAPTGGVAIGVRSSQPTIVTVPSTLYIPGGLSSFKFGARVIGPKPTPITITATDGITSIAGTLNVVPTTRTTMSSTVGTKPQRE